MTATERTVRVSRDGWISPGVEEELGCRGVAIASCDGDGGDLGSLQRIDCIHRDPSRRKLQQVIHDVMASRGLVFSEGPVTPPSRMVRLSQGQFPFVLAVQAVGRGCQGQEVGDEEEADTEEEQTVAWDHEEPPVASSNFWTLGVLKPSFRHEGHPRRLTSKGRYQLVRFSTCPFVPTYSCNTHPCTQLYEDANIWQACGVDEPEPDPDLCENGRVSTACRLNIIMSPFPQYQPPSCTPPPPQCLAAYLPAGSSVLFKKLSEDAPPQPLEDPSNCGMCI